MGEDQAEHHQRLKAALHYSIGKICEDLSSKIGGVTFSKEVVAAISELTDQQIATYARDLEKFSKHGKRTTINVEDVKLLARRNTSLASHLNEITKTSTGTEEKKKSKKKKDGTTGQDGQNAGSSKLEHVITLDDHDH